jgi:hypothetical protein
MRIGEIPPERCFPQRVSCAERISPPQNKEDNGESAVINVRTSLKFSRAVSAPLRGGDNAR